MPRRENTFRVDYSQFPKLLSYDEVHKFLAKELGLTRENVLLLQPSRRLGCTFVKVTSLELAEKIVNEHDNKHEFVFDGKSYKLRVTMEDGAVEVNLLELPEGVTNDQVSDFLVDYGEVISVRDLLWDDRYSDFGGVNTGVRVARMVVAKNIPSLVTIQGEETAVGYKGQRQTCLHCHEFAHIGIPCVQNKKLLVQKLTADLSYANVAKGPSNPTPTKPKLSPNPVGPRKPASAVTSGSVGIGQPSASGATTNPLSATHLRSANKQTKSLMPPPAVQTTKPLAKPAVINLSPLPLSFGTTSFHQLGKDGYETDSSHASLTSNGSRKHKKPANKKMKPAEGTTTTTTIESEHGRVSDDAMQQ